MEIIKADRLTSDKPMKTEALCFATSPSTSCMTTARGRLLTRGEHEVGTEGGLLLGQLMEDLYQELEEASNEWQDVHSNTRVPIVKLAYDGYLYFLGVEGARLGGYDRD